MDYRLKTTDLRCEEGNLVNWFSTASILNEVSLVEMSCTYLEIVKLVMYRVRSRHLIDARGLWIVTPKQGPDPALQWDS